VGTHQKIIFFIRSLDLVSLVKLRCDERFTHEFTAYSCVFKVIILVWVNQRNFLENATACSKRMRKTLVETQLKETEKFVFNPFFDLEF